MVLSDKYFIIFASVLSLLGIGVFLYQPSEFQTIEVEEIAYFEEIQNDVELRNRGKLNWKPVDKGAFIQSEDMILTKDESIAVIRFAQTKTLMKIAPNSLVKVIRNEKEINLAAESGFFDLDLEDAPPIRLAGKEIKSSKEGARTKIRIFKSSPKSQPVLRVIEGDIQVKVADGDKDEEPLQVASGEAILVESLEKKNVELYAQSPENFKTILPNEAQLFEWGAENVNLIILQISKDSSFSEMVYEKKSFKENGTVKLKKPGTYYWRVADEEGNTSFVKQITVIAPSAPKLILPENAASIGYQTGRVKINFKWESELKSGFDFELTHAVTRKVIRKKFLDSEVVLKMKSPGRYKWRVRSRMKFARWSRPRFFTIDFTQGAILALAPRINYTKNLEKAERFENIKFRWGGKVDGNYRIKISMRADMSWPILNQVTSLNTFEYLPNKGGKYFWSIESLKYPGVFSNARPFMVQQEVGEFISPADNGQISNMNSNHEVEFIVLRNIDQPVLLEVAKDKSFRFNQYRLKLSAPKKILNLRPGKYFARISPLPGNDQNIWKSREVTFTVKQPIGPDQPELPRYMQALLMNPEEAKRPKNEKYFVSWPEAERAIKYEVTLKDNISKKVKRYRSKDANLTLQGDYSESFNIKVVAIDSWGRRSPASKVAKLLFPISPLTKFPKYLRNSENWDYGNLDNVINQKIENEYSDELD